MITAAERTLACMPPAMIPDDRLVTNGHRDVTVAQLERVLGEFMPPTTRGRYEQRDVYDSCLLYTQQALQLAIHHLRSAHPSRHMTIFGSDILQLNREMDSHQRLVACLEVVHSRLERLLDEDA